MDANKDEQRRRFIKQLTALGASSMLPSMVGNARQDKKLNTGKDGEGFTFLFQGDSITDGARSRNNDWNHVMGHGYQYIIASKLWFDFPEKNFHFFNRGISGNKITDLTARWQEDTLAIQPGLLSILIGINDIAAFIKGDTSYSVEQYESGYRSLLEATRKQLPNTQFVLCEPFMLPGGRVSEHWEEYKVELQKRQQTVQKLAIEFNAVHVPFQSAFDKALQKAPASYWIWDGVHPMPAGHELMAIEWMQQVNKSFKILNGKSK